MAALEVCVIINPVAGRGRSLRAWRVLQRLLPDLGFHPVVHIADRPLAAWAIAERATRDGSPVVVAMGGDGTLHEIVNGILGAPIPARPAVLVLPVGTANIFARALGLPKDPIAAARLLIDGERRRVDVGEANGRYFATVAGVGFDGAVVRRARRWPRWMGGKLRHTLAALTTLASYRSADARLRIDGRELQQRLFLLAVANTAWYGGGIHIAPHARVDDGHLAVVAVGDIGRLEALPLVARSVSGRHLSHPRVLHAQASEVRIDSNLPLPVQADGEDVGTVPAAFGCHHAALEVFVPRLDAARVKPGPGARA